jgi:hypothetical protein
MSAARLSLVSRRTNVDHVLRGHLQTRRGWDLTILARLSFALDQAEPYREGHNLRAMRDDVRFMAIAVGLALLALFIPSMAAKLVVLTAIATGLIIAVLVR